MSFWKKLFGSKTNPEIQPTTGATETSQEGQMGATPNVADLSVEYCKRYRESDCKCINPDESNDENNTECSTDPTKWKECWIYKTCMELFPQKW